MSKADMMVGFGIVLMLWSATLWHWQAGVFILGYILWEDFR